MWKRNPGRGQKRSTRLGRLQGEPAKASGNQPGWAWLKAKGKRKFQERSPWIQGRPPHLKLQPMALGRNSSIKLVIQGAARLELYSLGPGAPFSETSGQLLGPQGCLNCHVGTLR